MYDMRQILSIRPIHVTVVMLWLFGLVNTIQVIRISAQKEVLIIVSYGYSDDSWALPYSQCGFN